MLISRVLGAITILCDRRSRWGHPRLVGSRLSVRFRRRRVSGTGRVQTVTNRPNAVTQIWKSDSAATSTSLRPQAA